MRKLVPHRPVQAAVALLFAGVLAAGLSADTPPAKETSAADLFEKPVRLKAGDAYIDSGDAWGHSGPCFHDVDGDGLRDLVVGDFSGLFRVYRNVGTDKEPRFAPHTYLMAGGVQAKVPIY
jgi:hypothetical protein